MRCMMTDHKIIFDTLPWESPLNGVRFKRYISENKQIRLVEYSKEFVEEDWCSKGHTGFVISGELEIDFDGTVVPYMEGDGIFIPAGIEHRHKAKILSDSALVFLSEDIG